jgi:SAM-dependent methyltransferase
MRQSRVVIGVTGAIATALLILVVGRPLAREVPFLPTPMPVVERMLEMANVRRGELLIDLGSGDGRIPVLAARKYGARGLGVDLNEKLVEEAAAKAKEEGVSDLVEFRVQDLFHTDLSRADVLTMYLLQSVNDKLRPRILKEMRPGARVVSHSFNMGPWKPDQKDTIDGRDVFMWIVPARPDGKWVLANGDQQFALAIRNRTEHAPDYEAAAELDGRWIQLENFEVRGEEITFDIDLGGETHTMTGRVKDGHLADLESDRGGNWVASPA